MHGAFPHTSAVWLLGILTFLKTTYPDEYFGHFSAQHAQVTSSTAGPKHPQAWPEVTKKNQI